MGTQSGQYSQKSLSLFPATVPVPTYPLSPIENPTAECLAVPPKLAFCVHPLHWAFN